MSQFIVMQCMIVTCMHKPHPPWCWLESCHVQHCQRCLDLAVDLQKGRAPALAHPAGPPSVSPQTAREELVNHHQSCTVSSHTPLEVGDSATALTANHKITQVRQWPLTSCCGTERWHNRVPVSQITFVYTL